MSTPIDCHCVMIGGALVHFAADEDKPPPHHATYQPRCDDCGRFLAWVNGWWACSKGCEVPH